MNVMKQLLLINTLVFLSFSTLQLDADTISRAGYYTLGYNAFNNSGIAYTITGSNIIFDLNNHVISGAGGGTDGVIATTGMTNVTIKNGVITNMSNSGITVQPACSNITISNVRTTTCTAAGFSCAGATGSFITNLVLDSCLVDDCNGTRACFISSASTINVTNFTMVNNVSSAATIRVVSCYDLKIKNISMSNNLNATDVVFSLAANTGATLENITLQNNSVSTGALISTCTGIVARNWLLQNNTSLSTGNGTVHPLFFVDGCSNVTLNDMTLANNTLLETTTLTPIVNIQVSDHITADNIVVADNLDTGSRLMGFTILNTTSCVMTNCQSLNNTSTSSDVRGFWLNNSSYTHLISCQALNNFSQTSVATGFHLDGTCTVNTLYQCTAAYNNGSTDANSFGINVVSSPASAFISCVGLRNGPVTPAAANQLVNIPGGAASVTSAVYTSLNGVSQGYFDVAIN